VSSTVYSVTATNNGCSSTATVPVTVNPFPTASASNSGPACVGGSITLNAGATGATAYLWHGPGSFTSSLASPVVAITSTTLSGTYSVMVTNGAGCATSSTTIVSVSQPFGHSS